MTVDHDHPKRPRDGVYEAHETITEHLFREHGYAQEVLRTPYADQKALVKEHVALHPKKKPAR